MADRIQKIISRSGLMSRRKAEELIARGAVTVDGRVVRLGDRAEPSARIEIEGTLIPTSPEHRTYLVYKPPGVISTASDPKGRQILTDLVPASPRVWPVGRLDSDSEGLILVSNDGDLTDFVTHPRYGITKKYMVLFEGVVDRKALSRLRDGVMLDDGPAKAISAKIIDSNRDTLIEMVMAEGRNREIRRMGDAIGHTVKRLTRTAIGPISDRSLRPGRWRELSVDEVAALYRSAGR